MSNRVEDFYKDKNFNYLEVAICLERFYKYRPGVLKFAIPIMEPYMSSSDIEENIHMTDYSNIMNKEKEKLNIKPIIETNAFSLELPADLVYDCDNDKMGMVEAGEKFLIEFVGGDINNARFLERYDQTPNVIDLHQIQAGMCINGFHAEKPGLCRFQIPILSRYLSLSGKSPYVVAEIPERIAATCPKDRYNIVGSGLLFNIAFIDGKLDRAVVVGRRHGDIRGNDEEREEKETDHDLNKVYEAIYYEDEPPYPKFYLPGLVEIADTIGLQHPVKAYIPDYMLPYIEDEEPDRKIEGKTIFGMSFINGDKDRPILVGVYQP